MTAEPNRDDERQPGAAAPASESELRVGARAFVDDLKTIPNLISIGRVVLIYAALILWYLDHKPLAAWIGLVAGLSDYLDGYLARKLNLSTPIGGLLDQVADALFVLGVIFVFVLQGVWPMVLLLILLFRELLVLNLRVSAAQMGFSLPSIFLGKWASNWIFYALAITAFAQSGALVDPYAGWAQLVAHFGMVVGVASSLIAGGIYFRSYARGYKTTARRAGAAPPAD